MIHTVVPLELLQAQPVAPAAQQCWVNGVPVQVRSGVICTVLSTDPAHYLRLPHLGRL